MRGSVAMPGSDGYDQARIAWNLAVDQRPQVVITATTEQDIVAAVDFAREQRFGVAVQGTGHGVAVPANGGVLVNTARMNSVEINGSGMKATVGPGARWQDVIPKAHELGLAPLSGSSSDVGVLGYTLGGGAGFLGRKYGYAADNVVSARLVTADGRLLNVSPNEHPDLFWAMRGGTSNFGIVTQLEFKLCPVSHVYGGGIFWPLDRAAAVTDVYREWVATVPDTVTSRIQLLHVPNLPFVPEPVRGKCMIAVQGALIGSEREGIEMFKPFRAIGGIIEDALAMIPFTAADSIARNPKDPSPAIMHTDFVDSVSTDLVDFLAEESVRPARHIVMVELRHCGGAFGREPEHPSAVRRATGFWMNALAIVPPGRRANAEHELSLLRDGVKPWTTGAVGLNGTEGFGVERVRDAYTRETWKRLTTRKRQYDPDNIFRLNRNVAPA